MKHGLANEEETLAFGSDFSQRCQGGDVILLHGDLGAGKTTWVRGFLRGFGYQGNVKSPTYTLVEPYTFDDLIIYHFDLYRLADAEELEYMGGRDYFHNHAICLIEWPDKAKGYLPKARFELYMSYHKEGRQVMIKEN